MNDTTPSSPSPRPRPLRWLRFSLMGFLLFAALVCVSVSHFGASLSLRESRRQVEDLRAQVRQLRDELGRFDVEDPKKVYVRAVPRPEEWLWKWRLWLPDDRNYSLRVALRGIPPTGYPENPPGSFGMRAGAQELTVAFYQDPNGSFRLKREVDVEDSSTAFSSAGTLGVTEEDAQALFENNDGRSWSQTAKNGVKVFPPDERITLLRLRVHKPQPSGMGSSATRAPSPGVMIWLEPGPPKKADGKEGEENTAAKGRE